MVGDMGHGISFLADGGGVAVLVVLIQPHVRHIGCLLDFSGFFLAERFVFQRADSSPWLMVMAWANLVCWPLWCCVIHCRRLWRRRSVVFMMR